MPNTQAELTRIRAILREVTGDPSLRCHRALEKVEGLLVALRGSEEVPTNSLPVPVAVPEEDVERAPEFQPGTHAMTTADTPVEAEESDERDVVPLEVAAPRQSPAPRRKRQH